MWFEEGYHRYLHRNALQHALRVSSILVVRIAPLTLVLKVGARETSLGIALQDILPFLTYLSARRLYIYASMDRSLATLIRSLQLSYSHEDALRLLPSATGLLSRLSNPLNVTLLSSQLLTQPSLYPTPISLSSCRSIFSVFYTAALRLVDDDKNQTSAHIRSDLSRAEWVKAAIQGADEHSPRWRHLLLLGGILLGFDGQSDPHLSRDMRSKIEGAVISASNIALEDDQQQEPNSRLVVLFVLNTVFHLLSDYHKAQLNYNLLLPELIDGTFFSPEGLEHGYWLGVIDQDISQVSQSRFSWKTNSTTARKIREIKSRPLVASLGPLARLIAHSVESVTDPRLLVAVVSRLGEFSRNLALSWKQNKLSELADGEERDFLDDHTIHNTLPDLLQLLRNTLFAIVICLRAVTGRVLLDGTLSSDQHAPQLAIQTLHILRDSYFISHKFGQESSSQYLFVQYATIDILNQYPVQAEAFLQSIRPSQLGLIPQHPLDRLNDLFFLNTAEHFTLAVGSSTAETLLITAALPYITSVGDGRLSELYEAAHSVLLAVFAAPQNAQVSAKYIPFYSETLLHSFPSVLSPRQFRLAIRNIMQVAAPYSPLGQALPHLQEAVLDMLCERLQTAPENILATSDPAGTETATVQSEKTVLLMCIIETLSNLPTHVLEEWLSRTTELVHAIQNPTQKQYVQRRFWEVLSDGSMDVERAAVCVAWWTSKGGREQVVFERDRLEFTMSGALPSQHEEAKL